MVAAPPEVITGRLMAGAGPGPMAASAASFTAAAAAFEVSIDRFLAHLATLGGTWRSPAAMSAMAAVERYLIAMRLIQAQLTTAAARTSAQAAAFSTAYATMAQMAQIVENRVTTTLLIATNFLGMNTIPIGVREGEYLAMTLQDIAVQETYLAASVANTTFEPFLAPPPITLGLPPLPPQLAQALQGATAATEKLRRATDKIQMVLHTAQMQLGQAAGLGYAAYSKGKIGAQQAQAQDALDRYREQTQGQDKIAEQLGQQVMQIPQQAASGAQSALQFPQQILQPVQQAGQQGVQQFSSQLSSLMKDIAPEHQVADPGFFDTQATSPTLDRLAGGGAGGAGVAAAALRVPGLGGLSGASTGFRFPGGWDSLAPLASPGAPLAPAAAGVTPTGRPMAPMAPLHALGQRPTEAPRKAAQRELSPLWGVEEPESETVSAGSLVDGGKQGGKQRGQSEVAT